MQQFNATATPLRLYTVPEVAEQLRLSRRYVEMRIADGDLPVVRIGTRVLVAAEDLVEFVRKRRTGTDDDMERSDNAAAAVLRAVELRLGGDGNAMVHELRGTGREVSLRLLEACELLHHLIRQSDRPAELLQALRREVVGDGQ